MFSGVLLLLSLLCGLCSGAMQYVVCTAVVSGCPFFVVWEGGCGAVVRDFGAARAGTGESAISQCWCDYVVLRCICF